MRRKLFAGMVAALAALAFALPPAAVATPLPPPTGDWTIDPAESPTLTGQVLTLPGSVIVLGHLTLDNCTLTFTPTAYRDRGISVAAGGQLDATHTTFKTDAAGGPDPDKTAYLDSSGTTNLTDCNLDHFLVWFIDASINTLTSSGLPWGQVTNGSYNWMFAGDSQNSVTGYDFACQNISCLGSSINHLEDCDFLGSEWGYGNCGWGADTTLVNCTAQGYEFFYPSISSVQGGDLGLVRIWCNYPAQASTLDLVDLAPGPQVGTVITSNPAAFRLELTGGTQVWGFDVLAMRAVALTTLRCDLCYVAVNRDATAVLTDSQIQFLDITTSWGGPVGGAADVAVNGFQDGGTPQTVGVTLNGGFFVDLSNTVVQRSLWELGNYGSPPEFTTSNTIENSTVAWARIFGDGELTLRNSIVETAACNSAEEVLIPVSTARLLADTCLLHGLMLGGSASTTTLQDTELAGFLVFLPSPHAPPNAAPSLILDGATFAPDLNSSLHVGENTVGAHISGTATIDPGYYVDDWTPGATIIRTYPILVKDTLGNRLGGIPVEVVDSHDVVVWSGSTASTGDCYALAEVTFTDANFEEEYRVYQRSGWPGDSAPLTLFSSTPIVLTLGTRTMSFTSFEEARYPWTEFAGGVSNTATWRQLGGTMNWRGLVTHAAHSGDYAMEADVEDADITGLRLDLPVSPSAPTEVTLRSWIAISSRTVGDASSFVGFTFGDAYPSAGVGWTGDLGWEVLSDTQSRLQLGATSLLLPTGLAPSAWHLVEMTYYRGTSELSLWLDGRSVVDHQAASTSGQTPSHAVLGAVGTAGGARQDTYFDDASVSLNGVPIPLPSHLYGSLSGPEILPATGATSSYALRYGEGYPALGLTSVLPTTPGAPPVPLTIQLSLPACSTFVSSSPLAPSRFVGPNPVWEVNRPALGEEAKLNVIVVTPSGVPLTVDKFWVYETTPIEGLITADTLPVRPVSGSAVRPDLAVEKHSALTASPGDRVSYIVRVANRGLTPATHIQVVDNKPTELGGGSPIIGNLASLSPGDTWATLVNAPLAFGVPNGTVFVNTAVASCVETEITLANNTGTWPITVTGAHDPNEIAVSPIGGVDRGDTLTYTLECENTGTGTAYAVYATAILDSQLDDSTLSLPAGMSYDPMSRTLYWEVGTLAPASPVSTSFQVDVASTARRARPVIGQATVYFPSVPEETPTNVVFNTVVGSFGDVPWDHWAVLQVELAYENGIVGGYPGGAYLPALDIDRGQMAVFISRSLAGGDSHVPAGPDTPTFSDVATSFWAYKYIEYAKAQNVVGGYSDGSYRPSVPVDRGQMAVFVARALAGDDAGVPPGPVTPTFSDVTATNSWAWCYKHVEYVVARGVVSGYSDGTYRPATVCTRDQMAVFVARAFELPM